METLEKPVEKHEGKRIVKTKESLAYNMINAIKNDYLNYIIITSKTQAAIRSEQHQFGAGKTTEAMQLSVRMHQPDFEDAIFGVNGYENWKPSEDANDQMWKNVFEDMVYNPCDMRDKFFNPKGKRINFGIYDDTQVCCTRTRGVPRFITMLVGEATAARPAIANVCFTSPSILAISAPLRNIIEYEIIIPRRGLYEIQRTIRSKVFDNPEADQGRLVPVEIGTFSDLPKDVKDEYNKWRVKQKIYLKSSDYSKRFHKIQKEAEGMMEVIDDETTPIPLMKKDEVPYPLRTLTEYMEYQREHKVKGTTEHFTKSYYDLIDNLCGRKKEENS